MSRLVLIIDSVPYDEKRDRIFDAVNEALNTLAAEDIIDDDAWEWFV